MIDVRPEAETTLSDSLRKRLVEAASTGEIISVVYQGGSQPGTLDH